METYKDFAAIYDQMQQREDYGRIAQFVIDHGKIQKETKVFEGGCGSGLLTQYLTQVSDWVTAVDQSAEMLQLAKKRMPHFKGLAQGDLTEMDIPEHDVAIFCSDIFHYFDSLDEVKEVLGRVFHKMHDNGVLIFDTLHPREIAHRCLANPLLHKIEDVILRWNTKRLFREKVRYDLSMTNVTSTHNEVHVIQIIRRRHMKRILHRIGFSQVRLYDNYTNGRGSNYTRRWTWIVHK